MRPFGLLCGSKYSNLKYFLKKFSTFVLTYKCKHLMKINKSKFNSINDMKIWLQLRPLQYQYLNRIQENFSPTLSNAIITLTWQTLTINHITWSFLVFIPLLKILKNTYFHNDIIWSFSGWAKQNFPFGSSTRKLAHLWSVHCLPGEDGLLPRAPAMKTC